MVFAHLKASKENDSFGEVYCVDWLLENKKSLLEKEKEIIEDAFIYGRKLEAQGDDFEFDYYNETFNTKER